MSADGSLFLCLLVKCLHDVINSCIGVVPAQHGFFWAPIYSGKNILGFTSQTSFTIVTGFTVITVVASEYPWL